MRVLMVLLALVAMPLAAGVAQEEPSDNPGVRHAWARGHDKDNKCDNDDRSDARRADRKDNDHDRQCADPPPPPPTTPPPSPTPPPSGCTPLTQATGGVTIKVVVDSGFIIGPPMCGVTVTASAPGITTVTGVTDATGTFTFAGLAPNTYTICEVVPSGWVQSWPNYFFFSCGLGVWGYQFAVNAAATVNFSNTHP